MLDDWSADGKYQVPSAAACQVFDAALRRSSAGAAHDGVSVDRRAHFSPDGKWVVYQTVESAPSKLGRAFAFDHLRACLRTAAQPVAGRLQGDLLPAAGREDDVRHHRGRSQEWRARLQPAGRSSVADRLAKPIVDQHSVTATAGGSCSFSRIARITRRADGCLELTSLLTK